MKCRRCIKEVKSSVKIVNQKTKSFVSISDFVYPGLRRVAFLSYVSWSKYNPCVLTTTNILYYEDLATGRQKQSDPQILCGLFTTCILVTWHIIKREKNNKSIFYWLKGLQEYTEQVIFIAKKEIIFGKELKYGEDMGEIKKCT